MKQLAPEILANNNIINNIPTIIYMTLVALMIGQSFIIMAITLIAFGWLP